MNDFVFYLFLLSPFSYINNYRPLFSFFSFQPIDYYNYCFLPVSRATCKTRSTSVFSFYFPRPTIKNKETKLKYSTTHGQDWQGFQMWRKGSTGQSNSASDEHKNKILQCMSSEFKISF